MYGNRLGGRDHDPDEVDGHAPASGPEPLYSPLPPGLVVLWQAADAPQQADVAAALADRGGPSDGGPKHRKVTVFVVPSTRGATLNEYVAHRSDPGATVYTDKRRSGLQPTSASQMVNHPRTEYVRGVVHTNTIEGVWPLVKRGIDGTQHAVSREHLQGYVTNTSGGTTTGATSSRYSPS